MSETPPLADHLARAIVDAFPGGVLVVEPDLRVSWWNPAAATRFGWTHGEGDRSLADVYWDAADARALALADRAALGGVAATRVLRGAGGERQVCMMWAMPLGERVALLVWDAEIRDAAIERLLTIDSGLRATLEAWPQPVCIHSRGRLVYANRALCEAWRGPLEDLIGRPATDLVAPEDRDKVAARMRALYIGGIIDPIIDEHLMRLDGAMWIAQVSALPIFYDGQPSVLVAARDTTEERRLKARLDQADRMVALGTLAAGVAHEIGNPLTYVLLRLDGAQLRLGELRRAVVAGRPDATRSAAVVLDDLGAHLAAVADGARRVRSIVGDLKLFSRADDTPTLLDVTEPLERALSMASHELRDLALERAYHPTPSVMASDARLTQVFLNLVLNAIHAVRAPGAGAGPHRVRLEVGTDGGQVKVSVIDSGCGIDHDELPHIFDPFYIGKGGSDGIGLGLAISRTIVASASGDIRVDSRPGVGSRFTVFLPAA